MFLLIETIDYGMLFFSLLFIKKIYPDFSNIDFIWFFLLKLYLLPFLFFKPIKFQKLIKLRIVLLIFLSIYMSIFETMDFIIIFPSIINIFILIFYLYRKKEKVSTFFLNLLSVFFYQGLVIFFILSYAKIN